MTQLEAADFKTLGGTLTINLRVPNPLEATHADEYELNFGRGTLATVIQLLVATLENEPQCSSIVLVVSLESKS